MIVSRRRSLCSAASPLVAALLAIALNAKAQIDFVIDSFDSGGTITFDEVPNATGYRVEWAPGPAGPWTNFTGASGVWLDNIPATGSGIVTASVPMVYRVVAFIPPPITFEMVTVGNPGNAADTTTYGAVAESFKISKFEVTNEQYTRFLNAVDPIGTNSNGVYSASMGSDASGGISFNAGAADGSKYSVKTNMGNKPVIYVSFFDSMRFVNWLENGQGSGGTESGVYMIGTGLGETRAANASYFIPSEDEWYKAAYHDPVNAGADGSGTTDYWIYPIQLDLAPTIATADANGNVSNPWADVANYENGAIWNGQFGNVTTVGSATATSFHGAFDMAGNVWEWNQTVISSSRGLRGGSFNNSFVDLRSSRRGSTAPTFESGVVGFRVASPQ